MFAFLSVIYVLVCLFLILVVLLQAGKGGGMGSAFGGGGGSQTVFGGAGAGNFLTRLTWISAVLFMLLSGTLAYMSTSSDAALRRAHEQVEERRRARDIRNTKAPTKAGEMSSPENSASGAAPTAPAAPAAPATNENGDPQAVIVNTGAAPVAPANGAATPQAIIQNNAAPGGPGNAPQAVIENTGATPTPAPAQAPAPAPATH
jgi:preprotein translocase subunit SecG